MTNGQEAEGLESSSLDNRSFICGIRVLDEFIRENTHLFGVIGVFAAATLYLSLELSQVDSIPAENSISESILIVGLTIILLLSLALLIKSFTKLTDIGNSMLEPIRLPLFMFSILFATFILTFSQYFLYITQSRSLFIVLGTFALISVYSKIIFDLYNQDVINRFVNTIPISKTTLIYIIFVAIFSINFVLKQLLGIPTYQFLSPALDPVSALPIYDFVLTIILITSDLLFLGVIIVIFIVFKNILRSKMIVIQN